VAALWPLAMARGDSLQAVLDALVLGYEVGARAGGWLRIQPGMHVDANWPSIGVAAGVAHLLGLPPAQVLQAMQIAACQLGTSLYLPVVQGHTSRNTYLAHSAVLGLQSALSAAAGVTAPADAMAHYASAHARAPQAPLPPAAHSLLLEGYLKPFAAVRHVHYGAVAAAQLREALQAEGLAPADVEAVSLRIYEEATVYCGNRDPRTVIQAQFSLSFGLAAMLRFGHLDPSVYAHDGFADAGLRRLEALVDIGIDAQRTAAGRRGCSLQLRAGGRVFDATVDAVPGDAGCPVDDALLRDKFMRYTARQLAPDRAHALFDALLANDAAHAATKPIPHLWQFVLLTEH
jgi:2-methylcitrate dehydratase PrpD